MIFTVQQNKKGKVQQAQLVKLCFFRFDILEKSVKMYYIFGVSYILHPPLGILRGRSWMQITCLSVCALIHNCKTATFLPTNRLFLRRFPTSKDTRDQ